MTAVVVMLVLIWLMQMYQGFRTRKIIVRAADFWFQVWMSTPQTTKETT